MPSQKAGIDNPTTDASRAAIEALPPGDKAEMTPSGEPNDERNSECEADQLKGDRKRIGDLGATFRLVDQGLTEIPMQRDTPIHAAYCARRGGRGHVRCSNSAISASVASAPSTIRARTTRNCARQHEQVRGRRTADVCQREPAVRPHDRPEHAKANSAVSELHVADMDSQALVHLEVLAILPPTIGGVDEAEHTSQADPRDRSLWIFP